LEHSIHALFSTGVESLRISVLRQTVVLSIPGTDEGSTLVVIRAASTHKSATVTAKLHHTMGQKTAYQNPTTPYTTFIVNGLLSGIDVSESSGQRILKIG